MTPTLAGVKYPHCSFFHIPSHYVVEKAITQRKPPEVRICTFPLGRHKARCVAVRLLIPPVKNRTDHFHGIRLNTCSASPCAHEAFLPISPAPQCIPRG